MTAAPIVDITSYDWIVVSSSAGKDSLATLSYIQELAEVAGVSNRLVVLHCDLGGVEWPGTRELAERQAERYSLRFEVVSRIGTESRGVSRSGTPLYDEGEARGDLLDQVSRRGRQLKMLGKDAPPWPDMANRWCTADFKRGPADGFFTKLAAEWRERTGEKRACRILDCQGLRAQESPRRAKMEPFTLRRSSGRLRVDTWLPIHTWTKEQVWGRIRSRGLEYHPAYDLGMPRLSCAVCVFSSRNALMIAGEHNPELLAKYVKVEEEVGWKFRQDLAIADIKAALDRGERATVAQDWSA